MEDPSQSFGVEIEASYFERRAEDLNIHDVNDFYTSSLFSDHGFEIARLPGHNDAIIRMVR